eukprot:6403004-Ditylum_brightwellii.AAC.2
MALSWASKFFTPEGRGQIANIVWDDERNPVIAKDLKIEKILQDPNMDWVIEGFPIEEEAQTNDKAQPVNDPHPNTPGTQTIGRPHEISPMFQGDPGTNSITTWGTTFTANLGNDAGSTGTVEAFDTRSIPVSVQPASNDTTTDTSLITIDSRLL